MLVFVKGEVGNDSAIVMSERNNVRYIQVWRGAENIAVVKVMWIDR